MIIASALLGGSHAAATSTPKFYPDDPISADHDDLSIDKPGEVELSGIYDVIENSFGYKPDDDIPPAVNTNTLGEVPNSSWFTNRIGVRSIAIEELVQGPARTGGPDTSAPLTIIAAKSAGISPGFTVRDARGDVYFVKFDPLQHPNLSTATDVIGSKFFWAIGYNVPENYIAYLDPDMLEIAPGTEVAVGGGRTETMDRRHLEAIFARVARRPDGKVRAIASLRLAGEPVGPFRFYGTRGDDPNDIFPHQHRRELRGYRVFCAWLNHDDSRAINTLDMYVDEDGRRFVKHYLLDFSSTLGSGSNARREIAPQHPRSGNENIIEFKPALKTAATLGIWERPWMNVDYAYLEYPEIGRIEAEFFSPPDWKPEYPNPAFERMLADDAFWAAKIVARFSDEAIRALVHTGDYRDPAAAAFLADILVRRRDKIVDHYFRQVNPLDRFRITAAGPDPETSAGGTELQFENLGEDAGLARAEAYEYEWFVFDNETQELTALEEAGEAATAAVPLPTIAAPGASSRRLPPASGSPDYVMARVRTRSADEPGWNRSVDVYVRLRPEPAVVGVEREM